MACVLIEAGLSAAKSTRERYLRESALEQIVNLAVEADCATKLPYTSPYSLAIHEVRSENPQKAFSIVMGLSQTMYSDHREDLHRKIFDNAMKREDLFTARYFAEHPVSLVSWLQANTWRRVAELQIKLGTKQAAKVSYLRALATIFETKGGFRYFEDVKTMVNLGESMQLNGFEGAGLKVTLDALDVIPQIPARRTNDRVKAEILIAQGLWRYGMHAEAKKLALSAYRQAVEYVGTNGDEKASLLFELGETIGKFNVKSLAYRVKRNDQKVVK